MLPKLVSVIMPAYNAEATIEEAIISVLDQSYAFWELIIVNDASTDNTFDLATRYSKHDDRITVITLQQNGGLPNARNQGINGAKGYYIAFLDSDDIWTKDKLLRQIDFHLKYLSIKISHTAYNMFNRSGVIKRPFKRIVELNLKLEGDLLPSIYRKNTIGVLTVMVERELLLSIGSFDTSLWTLEDQDLWIRIAEIGEPFGYIDESLALYRLNENGISNKVGKYKRAYKSLLIKHAPKINSYNIDKLVWANYFRYFGTVYYKRGNYYISILYFKKAIKFEKHILDITLNSIYMLVVVSKYLMAKILKKNS